VQSVKNSLEWREEERKNSEEYKKKRKKKERIKKRDYIQYKKEDNS
jgi:hypothetical protein